MDREQPPFRLGPITGITVHLHTGARHVNGTDLNTPRFLCTDSGEKLQPGHGHTWTHDRAAVTCAACLEWLHA